MIVGSRDRTILAFVLCVGLTTLDTIACAEAGTANRPNKAAQTQYVYKTVGARKLTLDVNKPPGWKPTDKRPAMVFFFGGGWTVGTPIQLKAQAEYFAKRGLVCLRADDRTRRRDGVTPDKCVEDAMSAMRWVRGHAGKLGIDPNRIVACGASAGGHLAACTWFIDDFNAPGDNLSVSPKLNAMLLYNPVVDLVPLLKTRDSRLVAGLSETELRRISPWFHVRKGAPPTFIIDGTADRFHSQICEFIAKNKALWAIPSSRPLPKGSHTVSSTNPSG